MLSYIFVVGKGVRCTLVWIVRDCQHHYQVQAIQDNVQMKIVDQSVSAGAATKYVHSKRTEHSSCATLKSCVMVPAFVVIGKKRHKSRLLTSD